MKMFVAEICYWLGKRLVSTALFAPSDSGSRPAGEDRGAG